MNILGLDLGDHMGVCVALDGQFTPSTIHLDQECHSRGLKLLRFSSTLDRLLSHHKIDLVAYEDVRGHKGTLAAHAYGAYKYTLTAKCESLGIECVPVAVGTLKKFATGSGRATKATMIACAVAENVLVEDDNAADAYWLARFAVEHFEIE